MAAMGDSFRNIERIEEDDDDARKMPWGVTTAFVVLGGACITFAVLALGGRTSAAPQRKSDPLGDLLAERSHAAGQASGSAAIAAGPSGTELSPKDVTFPHILSDSEHPATALAAVPPSSLAPVATPPPAAVQPPPPTDRLPVVPLPAQAVLEATPVVTRPRDPLTKAASEAAKLDAPLSGGAPSGHEGGYQLQVSSFPTQAEAQSFADQLRARGHKAYVVQANVAGRGTWYRVRIGPFATQRAAADYRGDFEDREHVVPFIVSP
ncbi:MAG TPA: SPOR domain-containing protein [Polyangiaceae bacterium]|jgi:cell division septation protein DedD